MELNEFPVNIEFPETETETVLHTVGLNVVINCVRVIKVRVPFVGPLK